MDLPIPTQDVLEALYQRRRECAAKFRSAEVLGDVTAARKLQVRMREIFSLINERGGNLDS